jgi:hypothetical protein
MKKKCLKENIRSRKIMSSPIKINSFAFLHPDQISHTKNSTKQEEKLDSPILFQTSAHDQECSASMEIIIIPPTPPPSPRQFITVPPPSYLTAVPGVNYVDPIESAKHELHIQRTVILDAYNKYFKEKWWWHTPNPKMLKIGDIIMHSKEEFLNQEEMGMFSDVYAESKADQQIPHYKLTRTDIILNDLGKSLNLNG